MAERGFTDLPTLLAALPSATPPDPSAPWPDIPDLAAFLWRTATPQQWQSDNAGDTGSPEYKLFAAFVSGLQDGRMLLDRLLARLDPYQAQGEDFQRLADWVNADPVTMRVLPELYQRKYVDVARQLAAQRGLESMETLLTAILGSNVSVFWDTTESSPGVLLHPYRRVVQVVGGLGLEAIKVMLRRHFPAWVEILLQYESALPPHTDLTYTGAPGVDYGWTLGVATQQELI